jgi:hypothetical protein
LSQDPKESSGLFALITLSLYELLRRERKCLLNDDLPELLDALQDKTAQFKEAASTSDLDTATIQLDMIRRMVDGARGRLAENAPDKASIAKPANTIHSTFPLKVVIPGGKHDNDFADVTKIQIFPTFGEVTSELPEYLPVTDLTQPHFHADPVRRHLDSAFRLLRHDIFGPLKEAIASVLAQTDVSHAASSSRFISANIRANCYSNATVQHVFVDKDLEVILSFSQPPQLRKNSLDERRRWWDWSSRLEPGGLVCLVTPGKEEQSFLLFVVTKKNTGDVPEGKVASTLVSQHHNPSVTLKVASENQQSLATLSRLFVEKREGLLLELPGLIPETFAPILENLQRMMRDGDLAFRRYILPTTDSTDSNRGQAPMKVAPPAYARRPGFKFRLQSITREGHANLDLDPANPAESVSLEALEAATGLDRGQSESLIAALTREYALIQGPPGTGKSYVGVQLVRVLLDHKSEANLGPIVVM